MIVLVDAELRSGYFHHFLGLPEAVYRGDPGYCATPAGSVLADLERKRFAGRQRVLLVLDASGPLARVVARVSPSLVDEDGKPYGLLGFFEAHDHAEAAEFLFRKAIDWLRRAGAGAIVGPMDGDTWHRYRLNVGPFDTPRFLMEPYNKPYYPALWEACGFEKLEGYHSLRVEAVSSLVSTYRPDLERAVAAGYELRSLDKRAFRKDLEIVYALSKDIFSENLLYEDISREDFLALYEPARSLIDPQLVWFAKHGSEYVGFSFAVVDFHGALAAMHGSRGPLAKLKWLLLRHTADAVNLKTLGVTHGHRRSGVAKALACRTYEEMVAKGYQKTNLCLIRDGNPSSRLDGGIGQVSRRYVLYRYAR